MRRDCGSWSGSAGKTDGFGVPNSPQHHQRVVKRWKRWSGTSHSAIGWEGKKQWPQVGIERFRLSVGRNLPHEEVTQVTLGGCAASIPGGSLGLPGPSPEQPGPMPALPLWAGG